MKIIDTTENFILLCLLEGKSGRLLEKVLLFDNKQREFSVNLIWGSYFVFYYLPSFTMIILWNIIPAIQVERWYLSGGEQFLSTKIPQSLLQDEALCLLETQLSHYILNSSFACFGKYICCKYLLIFNSRIVII